MFNRTRHAAWMMFCVVTLLLFVSLSALAQVSQQLNQRFSSNGGCQAGFSRDAVA